MTKTVKVKPTDAELEILSVLWEHGPSTVRDVHETLTQSRPAIGYTTVLKLMQIMHEKGLLERDDAQRAHVYVAKHPQENMQRQIVGDLLDKVFAGSAMKLVMHALESKRSSTEELAQIRDLLDEFERGEK
jgi:predicted transcriptional regulator